MKSKTITLLTALSLISIPLFANTTESSGGGFDYFSFFIAAGYLLGVFVLLPLVLYTNFNEKIIDPREGNPDKLKLLEDLTEEERNERAVSILQRIEEKLTPVTDEEGNEMITITNGAQSRFTKRGLDYILTRLNPTDQDILDRVDEFKEVYKQRSKRIFSGSYWIIACAAGLGLLFIYTGGLSFFVVIHWLGLLFYILSSRITIYGAEKRLKWLGGLSTGIIAGIMGGLFGSFDTKHYNVYSSGRRERDYNSELSGSMITILLLAVVAMIIGFLTALMGVINFLWNYTHSFLLPFKNCDQWYATNFQRETTMEPDSLVTPA
ncbi:MAG: hypothetical protein ACOC12_08270 [Bacteroidota bacterium]